MENLFIFLSSTTTDLGPIRERIAQNLNRRPRWKALNQENFGAQPIPPKDYCSELVGQSDLFIGLIGHRWGSMADEHRSFVEMECDVARELDKPRLIFLAEEGLRGHEGYQSPWETERQRQFRQKLQASGVTVERFSSWEELPDLVSDAVQKEWQEKRSQRSAKSELPLPPEPLYKPRYTNFSTFSGRESQRIELTQWFTAGEETVYGLIAGPAMGKSALAWMWIHQDLQGLPPENLKNREDNPPSEAVVPLDQRPRGIIRWSFDDEARLLLGGSAQFFQTFLRDALHYVSRGQETRNNGKFPGARLEKLLEILQSERYLLVLDGFEKELNRFQTIPARREPSGSRSSASWRDCSNAFARNFLYSVASTSMASRILLCSRVRPRALEGDDGEPLPFCHLRELGGLDHQEAQRFFLAQDLAESADPSSVADLCERLGGSPLGLKLSAKVLKNDREAHNSSDLLSVKSGTLSREEEIQQAFARSFDYLEPERQRILSVVAAFRGPVNRSTLGRIVDRVSPSLLDKHLRELLENPELLNLTQGHYDMHPLVRHFVRDRTPQSQALHERVVNYLAAYLDIELRDQYEEPGRTGGINPDVPQMDEINQYIELFHHLLGAGKRVEALVLFVEQLWEPLTYNYSDVGLLQELLVEAFPSLGVGDKILSKDAHESEAFGLHQLANSLRMGGRAAPAVRLHQAVVNWDRLVERPDRQAIRQELLGLSFINVGDYASARENLEEALQLSRQYEGTGAIADTSNRAACFRDLGRLHLQTGMFEKALKVLADGRNLAKDNGSPARKYLAPILALHALTEFRRGEDPRAAVEWAKKAVSANENFASPVARHGAEAKVILGMTATAADQLELAREALEDALRESQEVNHRRIEMMALLGMARFHLKQSEPQEALRDSRLATRFARDGGYIALEAEGSLLVAQALRDCGDPEEAQKNAMRARDLSRQRLDPRTERLRENELKPGFFDEPLYRESEELLADLRETSA